MKKEEKMKKVLFKMIVFFIISTSGFSFENEINNLFEDEKIEQSDSLVIEHKVKIVDKDNILAERRIIYMHNYLKLIKMDKLFHTY